MKNLLSYVFILTGIFFLNNRLNAQTKSPNYVSIAELKQRIAQGADTVFIVNFWATWCKPCVEEMPVLEGIYHAYKGKPVKVLLVSLDFHDQIENRLLPFIRQNTLKNEILILKEENPNNWIPMVNSSWSGAIPACWFIFKGRERFYEGQITLKQINHILNELIVYSSE
jgi:thiol-disulfide isomerase/thioredoxin